MMVSRRPLVIDVGDEPFDVLGSEEMRQFRPSPIGLTQLGPDDGVEARIPEPLERVHPGIGNGVSLRSPVRLEHGAGGGPDRHRIDR